MLFKSLKTACFGRARVLVRRSGIATLRRVRIGRAALCAAAVAIGATIPLAANAAWSSDVFKTTVDGITWTYVIDESAGKIGLYSTSGTIEGAMVATGTSGILHIPSTLTHTNGVEYNVTDFPQNALYGCNKLTGVVLPETTFAQVAGNYQSNGKQFFRNCSSLVAVWWKGPSTVSSGTQPVAKCGRTTYAFGSDSKLRAVVFGPNVTYYANGGSTYPLLNGCSSVTAFIPKARWTAITDAIWGGTNSKIVRYGAGEDVDVTLDGTFTVKTKERVDDVLTIAPYMHTYCGMSPKICVTNDISDTLEVSADLLGYVSFDLRARTTFKVTTQAQLTALLSAATIRAYTFIDVTEATETLTMPDGYPLVVWKVNTQAQLDAVLASFSESSIINIDPSDATESLTVPEGRMVMSLFRAGDVIKRKQSGLMLIVR